MKQSGRKGRKTSQDDESRKTTRRALLGTISAIGSVGATQLPAQWARPIVDHVLLPAHAQLSPGSLTACQGTCTQVAVVNRTLNTTLSAAELTNALTFLVTCERDPLGETVSTSSSTSASFTADVFPINTSASTSFSISQSGSDLCTVDISELLTIVNLA